TPPALLRLHTAPRADMCTLSLHDALPIFWFGIIMVVWLEIGLITPPVGLNLFVIQGLTPGASARDITRGTTPYVVLMIVLVVLLFLFPDLALWLPRHMMAR